MLTLTPLQKRVIHAAQLHANQSSKEIAARAHCSARAVQYHLTRLTEEGLIRKAPFLNVYPLGYRYVNVYFSIASPNQKGLNDLAAAFRGAPKVSWYAELGGNFHFGLSLMVQRMEEVPEFFGALPETITELLVDRSYLYHTHLSIFPYKHLSSKSASPAALGYGGNYAHTASDSGSFEADELDREILHCMATRLHTSGRAIARELGRPHATIELRLRRLEKIGVIAGYWYLVDPTVFGCHTYKALLYLKGPSRRLTSSLFEFSRRHPQIVYFIEGIGSWDVEIGVDSRHPQEITHIHRELLDQFGSNLHTVQIVPQFRVLSLNQFPLHPPRAPEGRFAAATASRTGT